MKKLIMMIVLLAIASFFSLFIGATSLSPLDLFNMSDQQSNIFWTSRVPRLISILIAGVGMSIAGLIMQQLTRNKFVSPTTAGTMDSARLGILVSIMLFSSAAPLTRMLIAMAFAIAGTFLFMHILNRVKFKDPIFIPLVGLMFGNIIGSITTFFAYRHDLIQNMTAWLQGNFATTMRGNYETLYMTIPLVLLAYLYANRFTVAGMGEDFSKNLGLNYKQVVKLGLVIVAVITSAIVLTVGTIPFLGLVVPNIVTIYLGDNIRKNLPFTAVLGAIFVLMCDILGRLIIFPYEIPIGLTVGVIGSGLFLYLLLRRRKYGL
jgi:iron complex transport system permease protein